jgi:hypothetical protein
MAVCLDYQSVYCPRQSVVSSWTFTLIASVILLAALSFRVWIKIESTEVGYLLAAEQQRAVEYDMERRDYELQLSLLLRPDNLIPVAKEKLALERLDPARARKIVY